MPAGAGSPGRRILATALVLSLALLAAGGVLAWRNYDAERDQQRDALRALARGAAVNAARFTSDRIDFLQALAVAPVVTDRDATAVRRFFERANGAERAFTGGIGWVDAQGRVRVLTDVPSGRLPPVDVSDRDYVRAALGEGRAYVGRAVLGAAQPRPLVAIGVPTRDRRGRVDGVLVGAVTLDSESAATRDLGYDDAADVRIVDRAGQVLLQPGGIRGLHRWEPASTLAAIRERGRGLMTIRHGGRDVLTAFATVPAAGWVVLAERPVAEADAGARRDLAFELGLLLLIAGAGMTGTWVIARRADRLALSRARVFEREHRIAVELQESMLPDIGDVTADGSVAVRYVPAEDALSVGGDFYEVIDLEPERRGIAVGDVIGHGLAAAAAMGQVRSALRGIALANRSPGGVLSRLDRFVASLPRIDFCTILYAVHDRETGTLTCANAGHPPLLVVEPDGTARFAACATGTPAGIIVDDAVRDEETLHVGPGATLVLYTDGLVERRGEVIDEGMARLARAAARHAADPPAVMADAILAEVGTDRRDDVALLCLRIP